MSFMFEDLKVYKSSMRLLIGIYALNGSIKDKIIKDQLRRAAMSIPLNIAEGQGRMHGREKRQFYNTARGSLLECIPLIQMCREMGYVDNENYEHLYALADQVGRRMTGLMKSLKLDSGQ